MFLLKTLTALVPVRSVDITNKNKIVNPKTKESKKKRYRLSGEKSGLIVIKVQKSKNSKIK
jgi:hypothetical protein